MPQRRVDPAGLLIQKLIELFSGAQKDFGVDIAGNSAVPTSVQEAFGKGMEALPEGFMAGDITQFIDPFPVAGIFKKRPPKGSLQGPDLDLLRKKGAGTRKPGKTLDDILANQEVAPRTDNVTSIDDRFASLKETFKNSSDPDFDVQGARKELNALYDELDKGVPEFERVKDKRNLEKMEKALEDIFDNIE